MHTQASECIARHDTIEGIQVGGVVNKGDREKSKTTAQSHPAASATADGQ